MHTWEHRPMPSLTISDLFAGYGEADILHGVNLTVPEGGRVGLVGANGAGKSTLVKSVNGLIHVRRGDIHWDGRSILGEAGHRRTLSGLATVAEGRMLFGELSVLDN